MSAVRDLETLNAEHVRMKLHRLQKYFLFGNDLAMFPVAFSLLQDQSSSHLLERLPHAGDTLLLHLECGATPLCPDFCLSPRKHFKMQVARASIHIPLGAPSVQSRLGNRGRRSKSVLSNK